MAEPNDFPATFQVRVSLDDSEPPIWRRLELRSDLTLDVVHEVLQAAYGWNDSHLHRFGLGGSPFDPRSELFLCPYEVEEGEEDGTPAADVRLDETLREPGDRLFYAYDYGDSWELTLELEAVSSRKADAPSAMCVAGDRAGPPDDCGGLRDAADLAEVLDDPARFDLSGVNAAIAEGIDGANLNPRLRKLLRIVEDTPAGPDLAARVRRLPALPEPDEAEVRTSLRAHQWLLDRAADGLPLTGSGYLKPGDVADLCDLVASATDWPGTRNRETHTRPVLAFRESCRAMGLLRKYKGEVVLTRLGKAARGDLGLLVDTIADHLITRCDSPAQLDATLLVLAYAASSPGQDAPFDRVAHHLTTAGWRTRAGEAEVRTSDVWALGPQRILRDIGTTSSFRRPDLVSPVAAYVARLALRVGDPDRLD